MPVLPITARLSYDQTHVLVFNYVYNLPTFVQSKSAVRQAGGLIANDWQISGITTFHDWRSRITPSSRISGIGNLNERYTGSPDIGPRVVMNGSPSYPKGIYQWMNHCRFSRFRQ